MMYYERIDASDEFDVIKSNKSKECMLCYYWYFLDKGYNYVREVCNGGHNIADGL